MWMSLPHAARSPIRLVDSSNIQYWLTLTAENGGRRIDQPDDWVAEEIGIALRRGTPVIPVLLDLSQCFLTGHACPAGKSCLHRLLIW
jgi:hypothetical protein